jgi:hypothetical protein
MRQLIDRLLDALAADWTRFARFEEALVARRCALASTPAIAPRYAGLDRPAFLRRCGSRGRC